MNGMLNGSIGALAILGACGLALVASPGRTALASSAVDPELPASITLNGVVRDFRELGVSGGHVDFELNPTRGFAHYAYSCADTLDSDNKPVFAATGYKVTRQWKDAQNRNIAPPRSYIASRSGDVAGARETTRGGAVTSADSMSQWFRDLPSVNMSRPLSITLVRQGSSNLYTFNDRTDTTYSSRGGFFPINGELFGNSAGNTKNYHFTFELNTEFVFRRGSGQIFTFTGDDDVFVFIDGKCVIDIGGIHSAVSQTIDLDRLAWLTDGQRYSLRFFFAERHRTQSNCRIDTTIQLENAELPPVAPIFD